MDKFSTFVSTVKNSDVIQQEASGGAGDKIVKCLAVIGLISTAKTLWKPLKNYVTGQKSEEDKKISQSTIEEGTSTSSLRKNEDQVDEKNKRAQENQRAAQLKERYSGEWAIIVESPDKTTRKLAQELAREGYNLIFIAKKEGPEAHIATSTSKFGVKVEFITSENFLNSGKVMEEAFKDKDISIVVCGITPQELYSTNHDVSSNNQEAFLNAFNSQIFLSAVLLPRLLIHHELTGKRGALIHVLIQATVKPLHKIPKTIDASEEVISPERTAHCPVTSQVFSAWQRAFNFTYGLGLTEQFRDQIDVLTAFRNLKMQVKYGSQVGLSLTKETSAAQSEGAKGSNFGLEESLFEDRELSVARITLQDGDQEPHIEDLVGSAKRDAEEEKLRDYHEEEENLAKEFEYVPLQLMYQHLQADRQSHGEKQYIGAWPFKKEYVSPRKQTE